MSFHSTDMIEFDDNQTSPLIQIGASDQYIIKEFRSEKSKGQSKRENFNTHIIRTMKKMINCLIAGEKPNCRNFLYYNVKDQEINRIWREIDIIYYEKIHYFIEKSELNSNNESYKSMNLAFLKTFFSGTPIKNLYSLTIDILFYYQDKEILRKNLCLCCCDGNHQENCDIKWNKLREYMKLHYLNDLKVN